MKSFELQASVDGLAFSKLTEIVPRGNNSNYSFVNELVLPGDNYYRLKMTDPDGKVTYSSTLNLTCSKPVNAVKLGPNPFNQMININIESIDAAPVSIVLFDVTGKTQLQKNTDVSQGSNSLSLDGLDKLPAGTYFLRITQHDQSSYIKLQKAGN